VRNVRLLVRSFGIELCGIFGFMLKKPLPLTKVMKVLEKLEVSKYPDEKLPVGGYGAGVAVLLDDGGVYSEKIGKNAVSPVAELAEILKPRLSEARVLIGHVRYPGLEFMDTVKFKEGAQPYVGSFEPKLTIVSAHNGRIENYLEIKAKLKEHVFESEKARLIDSEVIPHYFGELLAEELETETAVQELLCTLKGKTVGAISLLQLDDEEQVLHLLHKGWSRGLMVWANEKGEVVFCTRPEPVQEELKQLFSRRGFKAKAVIKPREEAELKLSFPVPIS
jgi:glucosamine 6-phosphate synthetase-like amidotransferase/phosphosugar isomerase protein